MSSKSASSDDMIVLKSINTRNLVSKYRQGRCRYLKITPSNAGLQEAPENQSECERRVFKDKDGRTITLIYPKLPRTKDGGYRCMYDTCKFGSRELPWEPFGVPIKMHTTDSDGLHIVIEVIDCVCSYECAYALCLKNRNDKQIAHLYINSESILMYLYALDYPNSNLRPAGDPHRKLKKWCGDQSIEEFRRDHSRYIPLSYAVVSYAKIGSMIK